MTTHGRFTLILMLAFLTTSPTLLLGQTPDSTTPGSSAANPVAPAAEKEKQLEPDDETAVCAAIADYENASDKAAGAKALGAAIKALGLKGTYVGNCPGGSSFRIVAGGNNSKDVLAEGDKDFVIALSADSSSSKAPGRAIANNTGPGVALAVGGNNLGTGPGGEATATSSTGNAIAEGGYGAGDKAGGVATATTSAAGPGGAYASGGAGGNKSGSSTSPGGSSGMATVKVGIGGSYQEGASPVTSGMHGSGTSVSLVWTLVPNSNPAAFTLVGSWACGGGTLIPN